MNRPRVVYFPSGRLVYFPSGARSCRVNALSVVCIAHPERERAIADTTFANGALRSRFNHMRGFGGAHLLVSSTVCLYKLRLYLW